jgi:hypothetical protein
MTAQATRLAATPLDARLQGLGDPELAAALDERGFAVLRGLLAEPECSQLRAMYAAPDRFRSRVVMARHGFGRGEYQYFAHPLPELVATLREAAYSPLAPIANRWCERLRLEQRFPTTLGALTAECHARGQLRPTPLLLKYGPEDYNCLHQDVYGELVFPIQLAVLLSEPGEDFEGGEFLLVEQRPRRQSRAEVVPLRRGDAVVFAVRERPMAGTRGDYRVQMKHGVSRLRHGERFTLGVIFHDAT